MGPVVRLPLGDLALWKLGAGAGAGVMAGLLGAAAGPGFDIAGTGLGVLTVVVGACMSMMLLGAANQQGRQVFSWATLVMAGSMLRLLVSLALAMGIYFAAAPAKAPFFAAFLVGSLAVLAVETVIVRKSLLAVSAVSSGSSIPSAQKKTESA